MLEDDERWEPCPAFWKAHITVMYAQEESEIPKGRIPGFTAIFHGLAPGTAFSGPR
jgi:hypothetical protein